MEKFYFVTKAAMIIFFIVCVLFRPSFVWLGEKRALYKKLKKLNWTFYRHNEIRSGNYTIDVRHSYGIAGSRFSTYRLCENNVLICDYESSTNPIDLILSGVSNPLGKIIDPIMEEIEYKDWLKQKEKKKNFIKS